MTRRRRLKKAFIAKPWTITRIFVDVNSSLLLSENVTISHHQQFNSTRRKTNNGNRYDISRRHPLTTIWTMVAV